MNRRKAIKLSILAGSTMVSPALMSSTLNHNVMKKGKENGTKCENLKVNLGNICFYIFSDGYLTLNQPQPTFAPAIPPAQFMDEMEKSHLTKNIINFAINVMLIKTQEKTILIDAGMGNHFGDKQGWLLNNIENAGFSRNSITDILITHAHRDHIGGLITNDVTIVYPNAKYHIAKEEYDFWMSDNPDFSKSKLTFEQKNTTIDFTKKVLNRIKEKIVLFHPGDFLFSLVQTELAAGHTPGHTIFTISSEGKSIKNVVDVFHSPLLISNPEWGIEFDINFEQGIRTRTQILEDCYINKQLVMSSHLPWPGLGYIDKRDKYFWSPIYYYTPTEINL